MNSTSYLLSCIYSLLKLVGWGVFAIVVLSFAWRFLSERYAIPCPAFLGKLIAMENPLFRNSHASVIVNHLKLTPGMSVLEVGCGSGRVTIQLAKVTSAINGKVFSIDVQESMLEQTQEKVKRAGFKNVSYQLTELGNGELPKNSYDLVVFVNVLGEIPKEKQIVALRELYESLKPSGILSVSELICDPHFQTEHKVLQLAYQVGFVKDCDFGWWPSYTLHLKKLF